MGATLVLRRGDKTRTVLLENFYTGMKKNVLVAGEFIEAIELPKPTAGQVFRAHKVSKRFEQDISATCAAISYQIKGGNLLFSRVRAMSTPAVRAPPSSVAALSQ